MVIIMKETNIREQIIAVLAANYIFIDLNETEDVDLSLYIEDSIQFITFIVELEKAFDIEIPDEALDFDKFRYLNYICIIIEELKKG